MLNVDLNTRRDFIRFQRDELTSSLVYAKLASIEKNEQNKKVLNAISFEELEHCEVLMKYTGIIPSPYGWKVIFYYVLARIFGLTFAIKLMENGESEAQDMYARYKDFPEVVALGQEEEKHEEQLIAMINEERLSYMGSVVLGLNDALVEFTGALAGFTLALNDSKLIALTGSITGIAAALSMASSEYLSTKSDGDGEKHPVKAAVYTGFAYIVTVFALILPFILISNVLVALGLMLVAALIIIGLFNYYYAVAKSESFKKRFVEMAVLSFSVATVSFLIGYALKYFTGIEA